MRRVLPPTPKSSLVAAVGLLAALLTGTAVQSETGSTTVSESATDPEAATVSPGWPQFRGPSGDGHAPAGVSPPLAWGEDHNVAWKVEVPGEGFSSPVVEDGQVVVTTAFEEERSLRVLAFDLESGALRFENALFQPEAWQVKHTDNSQASPTAVLEPGRIYAHFGAYGTAALASDDGRVLWRNTDFVIDHETGPGSSPILYDDLLIVNFDGTDHRYVVALDKDTGGLVWKADRSLPLAGKKGPHRKAFSTPFVTRYRGQDQLVSPAAGQVSAYDPRTGEELWWVAYDGYSNVPRPVAGFGLVFVTTGYMQPEMLAIHLGGTGDVSSNRVVWRYRWQVPANPSPLLVGHRLFLLSDWGRVTWLDAHNGDDLWRERLGGQFSASPVLVGGTDGQGRIYVFSREGEGLVLAANDDFEILARNTLDGIFRASPAVVGDSLVVRTTSHLYRLADLAAPAEPSGDDSKPKAENPAAER